MERRSRSQTRRNEGSGGSLMAGAGGGAVPAAISSRHASSSRLPEAGHAALSYPRPPEQARTLSPDRRERYRASGRGYGPVHPGEGPASLPPPRPDTHPQGQGGSVTHSNSNSYNQYNHSQYPLTNGYGELPPPRPHPPYSGGGAPPRPDPPSGYPPAPSPSKPAGAEQKAAAVGQVTLTKFS